MNSKPENYDHPLYTHVKDEKEADSIAWAFTNAKTLVKFPYKRPELADDEILIKNTFIGLCHSDVITVREGWGPCNFPMAPGHEIIGRVAAIGKNVKKFKIGDKVGFGVVRDYCGSCKPCSIKRENYCTGDVDKMTYGTYWGGYSTHTQQPEKLAYLLPDDIKEELASPIFCAGLTVYAPILRHAKPGDKTAVIGIGGLGHLAVQYLAKMGYDVTAVSTAVDKEKLEWISKLGANKIISYSEKDLKENASKFDFIIDTVPSSNSYSELLNLTAPFGTFIQVGLPESAEKLAVNAFALALKPMTLIGSFIGSYDEMNSLLEFTAKHQIYPLCETYKFEDLPKGFEHLEHGRPKFRVVVDVREFSEKNNFFK